MATVSLFDEVPGARGEPRRLTLVQLSKAVAQSLAAIGRVAVEGEVVKPFRGDSGFTVFTLKDRACQISVWVAAKRARRCRAVHGERVRVTGSIVYRNDRGELRLEAEEVLPVGEGAIAALIAEARARLLEDGLLDRPPRRWPRLPRAIGVVCGGGAAVRADIESVVAARFPGYPVRFEEVPVTGPGAAEAVGRALVTLERVDEVEVVILARGGGDATDLLPFSDEALCRTVAAATKPVVSAIGHEGDRPLCDEVADHRYGTPSLAATAVVPERAALESELSGMAEAAWSGLATRLAASTERVRAVDLTAAFSRNLDLADARKETALGALRRVDIMGRVESLAGGLASVPYADHARSKLERASENLQARQATLVALDPSRVLSRGYAVVRSDGHVLRDAAGVDPGAALEIELARGTLLASADRARPEGSRSRRDH